MEKKNGLFFFIAFVLFSSLSHDPVFAAKKSYIVYLGSHPHGDDATLEDFDRATDSHHELLASFVGSRENAKDAMIYSYNKVINGFAAHLEEEEAQAIANHPDVVTVFENKLKKLHTTHSWAFVGMERDGKIPRESIFERAKYGESVIIANIDTGVWPESKSFSDEGYGPVPSRWKGFCENNTKEQVPCNRKLIGAKYYNDGWYALNRSAPRNNTARDYVGHGSHTLSTAAGNLVPGVNIFGGANGTAKGGSPRARVAAYKACTPEGCADADILAGLDNAIYDGVDVISVSIGTDVNLLDPTTYLNDPASLGSLHAVQRGITVSCSAGNSGPLPGTVVNIAPWVITVGASTIDREFSSNATLGNKRTLKGASLATKNLPQNKLYPLINAAEAAALGTSQQDAGWCSTGSSLDSAKVKGKIVVCVRGGEIMRMAKGLSVLQAGGAGMILVNDEANANDIIADPHVLPATMITYNDGISLFAYLNSTKSPVGSISPSVTTFGHKPAPIMAAFSSQGPSFPSPQILKPDITAPGVSILAAYSEGVSASDLPGENLVLPYNILSGTSMSCPHVAGVAGLVKSLHPDWSSAAVRSAIMTTARTRDNTGKPIQDAFGEKATPFSYGAGHIRPNRAADPGLVYDATFDDYLNFLCALGFKSSNITRLIRKPFTCPSKPVSLENLNYPSITVANLNKTSTITRTLKNVGTPGTYKARIEAPFGTTVTVKPDILKFDKAGDEKTFTVTFDSQKDKTGRGFVFGRLIWSDGKHFVRSPLTVNAIA